MNILHLDTSARYEQSVSRWLSAHFVAGLTQRHPEAAVTYLDLARNPPAYPDELFSVAMYTPPADRTPAMSAKLAESDQLIDQLLAADLIVMALPMYNFTVPAVFKTYIDNIVRIGRTFAPGNGTYQGLLGGKTVVVITSRGGDYTAASPMAGMDVLTPYLKVVFGFIGIDAPIYVDAQPTQFAGLDARESSIRQATAELDALVGELAGEAL